MYEPKYPIIHIYPTIQGQGPRMGEPMTLVRTSSPWQFREFIYHMTVRDAIHKMMTIDEIVAKCKEIGLHWIFFGGDDPCINEFNLLAKTLQQENFSVWLDTTGMFPCNPNYVDWLSVGPKPLLPFIPDLVHQANDVRLYFKHDHPEMWIDNYERVRPHVRDGCPMYIAPRVLTQECIDAVIEFVLSKAGQMPIVRADIPLFRTLPNFDKNFNKGETCPICHLMDEFQGVRVKSCLEVEEEVIYKEAKQVDTPEGKIVDVDDDEDIKIGGTD